MGCPDDRRPGVEARRGDDAGALSGWPLGGVRQGRTDLRIHRSARARSDAIDKGEKPLVWAAGNNSIRAGRPTARNSRLSATARTTLHRHLRRPETNRLVYHSRSGSRHQPDVVSRRQAPRVHQAPGPAVRDAVPAGRGGIGNPPGPPYSAAPAGRAARAPGKAAVSAAGSAAHPQVRRSPRSRVSIRPPSLAAIGCRSRSPTSRPAKPASSGTTRRPTGVWRVNSIHGRATPYFHA